MNTETEETTKNLLAKLDGDGWTVVSRVIDPELLDGLCDALGPSLKLRNEIRSRKGLLQDADGTLHHLLGDANCYIQLLKQLEVFHSLFQAFFGGNYILNSYGGVWNSRGSKAYVHNIHRDLRFTSTSKRFMLNVLVMLDSFTIENGATYLLSGSQNEIARPKDAMFFDRASRAIGDRGSVIIFDSRLWHATGINETDDPRRALTLTLTCPFFKPQLDYPRLLGFDHAIFRDEYMRQIVGLNARVPTNLEEFYAPVEERFYKRGQDD